MVFIFFRVWEILFLVNFRQVNKKLLTSFENYFKIKILLALATNPPKGGDYFLRISTILVFTSIKILPSI